MKQSCIWRTVVGSCTRQPFPLRWTLLVLTFSHRARFLLASANRAHNPRRPDVIMNSKQMHQGHSFGFGFSIFLYTNCSFLFSRQHLQLQRLPAAAASGHTQLVRGVLRRRVRPRGRRGDEAAGPGRRAPEDERLADLQRAGRDAEPGVHGGLLPALCHHPAAGNHHGQIRAAQAATAGQVRPRPRPAGGSGLCESVFSRSISFQHVFRAVVSAHRVRSLQTKR